MSIEHLFLPSTAREETKDQEERKLFIDKMIVCIGKNNSTEVSKLIITNRINT